MKRLLIFDLDGTLIDSASWLLSALNQTLEPWLEKPWSREELIATAGGPEHQVFSQILPKHEVERALLKYGEALRAPGVLRPQPGIEKMLATLREEGFEFALFSGAGRALGELRLSHLGWENRFPVRIWGDEVEAKPSPQGILRAMEEAGGSVSHSLYIGDTPKDAQAAHAAGIGFLGCLWGDVPGGVPGEWNAETPDELVREIRRRL